MLLNNNIQPYKPEAQLDQFTGPPRYLLTCSHTGTVWQFTAVISGAIEKTTGHLA